MEFGAVLLKVLGPALAQKGIEGIAGMADAGAKSGGVTSKHDPTDLTKLSMMPSKSEMAFQAALSPAQQLAEEAIASNKERAEQFGTRGAVSDERLKSAYTRVTGQIPPPGITVGQKRAVIRAVTSGEPGLVPIVQAEEEEEILPPVPPSTSLGMEELNRAAAKALFLENLGRISGGLLSAVGGAGGVGSQDKYGVSPEKVGAVVAGIGTSAGMAQRQALARGVMEREKGNAEAEIAHIRSSGQLTDDDKQKAIRAVMKSYNEEMERVMRTLGLIGQQGTPGLSDSGMKNIRPSGKMVARMLRDTNFELSDEDYKCFSEADPDEVAKGFLQMGGPWSGNELQFLHGVAKANNNDQDYAFDVKDAGIWSPDTLNGYARFIKNSVYTYKPEATEIDASIDPNEEHIGPMAQEIEKVNPACIQELPDGTKTVDTGRLSLMTSGSVGDLARQNIMQGKAIEKLMQEVQQLKAVS